MRAVNLLPAERRKGAKGAKGLKTERERSFSKLHGIGLAILLVGGGLAYWGHGIASEASQTAAQADDLEAQVQTLTTQINAEKAKIGSAGQGANYEIDKALVTGLAQARVNWSTVTLNLSRVAPPGLWLESIAVQTPTSAAGSTAGSELPTAITVEGHALSRTTAVQFISRLDAIPGFEEPRLQGGLNPEESDDGAPVTYSFALEIPINDGVFGPVKPARAAAPAAASTTTATPTP